MKKASLSALFALSLFLGACTDQIPQVELLSEFDLLKPDQNIFLSASPREVTITGSCATQVKTIYLQLKNQYVEVSNLPPSLLVSAKIDCPTSKRFSLTLNIEATELGFTSLSSNSLVLRVNVGRVIEDNAIIVQVRAPGKTDDGQLQIKVKEGQRRAEDKGFKFKVKTVQ